MPLVRRISSPVAAVAESQDAAGHHQDDRLLLAAAAAAAAVCVRLRATDGRLYDRRLV